MLRAFGGRCWLAMALVLVLSAVLVGCASTGGEATGGATSTSVQPTPPACPPTLIALPSPTQTPGGSKSSILPTRLSFIVFCRYAADPNGRLTKRVTVTSRSALAYLRNEVNSLVPLSPSQRYPCPLDDGARIDGYFGSTSGTLERRFDLRGCQFITGSNSAIYGLSNTSHRLLLQIEQLVD
jgi:hypothetical protein